MSSNTKVVKFFKRPVVPQTTYDESKVDIIEQMKALDDGIEGVELKSLDNTKTNDDTAISLDVNDPLEDEAPLIASNAPKGSTCSDKGCNSCELPSEFYEEIRREAAEREAKNNAEFSQYREDTTLSGHVFRNDPAGLENDLRLGKDPNSLDHNNDHTALHHACYQNQLASVAVLLKYNATVDARNTRGETPLMWAVKTGNLDTVRTLVKAGADVHVKDAVGLSALLHASERGHEHIVAYFLHVHNFDVDTVDAYEKTSLHWAAWAGHASLVRFLLANNANRFKKDEKGCLPIHWACVNGHQSVVNVLLSYYKQPHYATHHAWRLPYRTPYITDEALAQLQAENNERETPFDIIDGKMIEIANPLKRMGHNGCKSTMTFCYRFSLADKYMCYFFTRLNGLIALLGGPISVMFLISLVYALYSLEANFVYYFNPIMIRILQIASFSSLIFWSDVTYSDPGTVRPEEIAYDKYTYGELYKTWFASHPYELPEVLQNTNLNPCITCKVLRPLRAKHCPLCDRCVEKFDHHCPFFGTDIAASTYSSFIWFLIFMSGTIGSFLTTFFMYCYREGYNLYDMFVVHTFFTLSHLWFILCFMMGFGLLVQHISLIRNSLTTNESMNTRKYAYLLDTITGKYKNPFHFGAIRNAMTVLCCFPNELPIININHIDHVTQHADMLWDNWGSDTGGATPSYTSMNSPKVYAETDDEYAV